MTRYNILFKGNLLQGFDADSVKNNLVRDFGLLPEAAERILQSQRVYLKKNLDPEAARQYEAALKRAGLDVAVAPCSPAARPDRSSFPSPAPGPEGPRKPETDSDDGSGASPPVPRFMFFTFRGDGFEYFKIWIVNILLSIVTFGIYSAWAKVRRKQYFYGNTSVNGASFEYLADPVNILKGRFIVAVFFGASSLLSKIHPLAGTAVSLLLLVLLPWLVVRSLTFNAQNSAYRNIRFGFCGTVGEAAKVFLLFPVLSLLTLGGLFPYAFFRQKKFIVENLSYGTTPFTFAATPKAYYKLCFKSLIPIAAGIVLTILAGMTFPPLSALIGMVLYLYLFAYFSVATTNLLFNTTTLGRHGFDADLTTPSYLTLIFVNSVASVFTLGFFTPWAQVRTIRYKLAHIALEAAGDLDAFVAQEQQAVSAIGEEAGDFFDLDIGL